MQALSDHGGTPVILRYMLEHGHLDGDQTTLTGKTLREELMALDDTEYQTSLRELMT
jgi:dihydroxy-acid dehydratase